MVRVCILEGLAGALSKPFGLSLWGLSVQTLASFPLDFLSFTCCSVGLYILQILSFSQALCFFLYSLFFLFFFFSIVFH